VSGERFARVIANKKVPDWVPPLVVASSAGAMRRFGQEVVDRLLTDARMESVWQTLRARNVNAVALDALPSNLRLDNWVEGSLETGDATPNDEACVAFFAAAVIEFKLANKPVYASDVSELIGPWREAARQCRLALRNPLFRPLVDGEFERSLSIVERFFEERAAFVESGSSPYLLGRERKDDAARGIVRGIAKQTKLIFGQFLYGTIATVASVGLQPHAEIGPESVRKWCAGL
jgi:hypothetical protein